MKGKDKTMYIKLKMREAWRKFFPELKPVGYDDQENPCYTLEDIAKALDLTIEEVREAFNDLDPKRIIPPDKLNRIQ
jgi:hypothetical protein